jgi:plastocyanin
MNVGAEITWTNDDTQIHTVTSGLAGNPNSGQIFDSGILSPVATFSQTLLQPGIFPYYWTLHPQMVGTVIIS